jgi:hypothetical protein
VSLLDVYAKILNVTDYVGILHILARYVHFDFLVCSAIVGQDGSLVLTIRRLCFERLAASPFRYSDKEHRIRPWDVAK